MTVFSWLEGWYNPGRRHSAPDEHSPVQVEKEENQEINYRRPEGGFPTAGLCVACATPAAQNSAQS
jgi:hypothetical protein